MNTSKPNGFLLLVAVVILAGLAWWMLRGEPGGGRGPVLAVPVPTSTRAPPPAPVPAPTSPQAPSGAEESQSPPADAVLSTGILLLARDAHSRAPLPGARVWPCSFRADGSDGPLHTGEVDPGLHPRCIIGGPMGTTGSDGRVQLNLERDRFLHVVAPGHGWGKVTRAEDGSLVADLAPGGVVRLTVRRWAELEEPVVLAYRGEMAPDEVPGRPVSETATEAVVEHFAEEEGALVDSAPEDMVVEVDGVSREVSWPRTGEEVLVEGLEPGNWTFFVERGAEGGEVYARGAVTVAAGGEAVLLLDAVPTTAGPRAPVKATVFVSLDRWEGEFDVEVAQGAFIPDPDPFLVLRGLDLRNAHLSAEAKWENAKPATAAGQDRWSAWSTILSPDLPPGRYRATVSPPGWTTEVVVPEGTHEITLRVPDPAEAEVHLTDSLTGRPIQGRVLWTPFPGGGRRWSEADPVTGVLLLRAPPGDYTVDINSPGHRDLVRTLTLQSGSPGRVEYALAPAASVRVLLRVDGAPFDGNAYVYADMKFPEEEMKRLFEDPEAQESGVVTGQSGGVRNGTVLFENLTPGPCEVRVLPVPGFAPVTPRTVQVHAGRTEEVVFDLAKE